MVASLEVLSSHNAWIAPSYFLSCSAPAASTDRLRRAPASHRHNPCFSLRLHLAAQQRRRKRQASTGRTAQHTTRHTHCHAGSSNTEKRGFAPVVYRRVLRSLDHTRPMRFSITSGHDRTRSRPDLSRTYTHTPRYHIPRLAHAFAHRLNVIHPGSIGFRGQFEHILAPVCVCVCVCVCVVSLSLSLCQWRRDPTEHEPSCRR